MHARAFKLIGAIFALAVLASPVLGVSPLLPEPAAVNLALAQVATDPTFDLCARVGDVDLPGATDVPIWGFTLDEGAAGCSDDTVTLPGPIIEVGDADDVTINLTNFDVPENVSVVLPGVNLTPDLVGVAAGDSTSYSFSAADADPGTYLYQSGAGDQRGVLMGLYGALIVNSGTAGQAYGTAASAYDVQTTLVLSEIDTAFNANPTGFDLVGFHPTYWLINGKAYPDTDPIAAAAGDRVLLRYLDAGSLHHTMALLGTHQRVIARDAYPVSFPYDVVAETIASGQTTDVIVEPCGGSSFPVYESNLHLTNGAAFPGGMLTFIQGSFDDCPAPPVNQPPQVNAGSDQTVAFPGPASLDGTVTDDGLSSVSALWTQQSGPGTVTFGDATAVDTTATFSATGNYVLRLTADDGVNAPVFDEMSITVNAAPMHVGDLDGTVNDNVPGNRWRAIVTVTVHDANHSPVSGAFITGTWSAGDTNGRTLSCTTNGAGQCLVTSGRIADATASVTFTVTNVTKANFTYQAGSNHDPDGDSTGTAITVNRL